MTSHEPRVAMSSVDKAWLRMDRPTNLMIINGLMLFDEVLDFARFTAVCEQRLVGKYARFRQRIIESLPGSGNLYWETDPYFDIRSHIRRIALPAPGDMATLQSLISMLMNESLDRNKPLWRFYLIENVITDQGNMGCAVLGRFHHCIADGIALIQVLLSLTDTEPNAAWVAPKPTYPHGAHRQSTLDPWAALVNMAQKTQGIASNIAKTLLYEAIQTLDNPAHTVELARSAGIITAAGAAILAKLLLIPPDRASVLKDELSTTKQVAWSDTLDLAQIKTIGRAMDATVNDVLVAAVVGGLRRYLQLRGDLVDQGELRAMVPVNLRAQTEMVDKGLQLGNRFSLIYLALPVNLADPYEQLLAVKQRMDMLKQSLEPLLVYQVLHVLGLLPGELADWAIRMFASKATVVLTNVPGPRQQLYFAGRPLQRIMFWVPQSGEIGVGISIISYAGSVTVGLVVDEQLVQEPQAMIDHFHAALLELAHVAGVNTSHPV